VLVVPLTPARGVCPIAVVEALLAVLLRLLFLEPLTKLELTVPGLLHQPTNALSMLSANQRTTLIHPNQSCPRMNGTRASS
jgi:hypothetical protein